MSIRLSILIATIPKREWKFNRLVNKLDSQIPMNGCVEVLFDNSMDYNIGVKRNLLLGRALGDYVVFVDDDDMVSDDYTRKILQAMEGNPDCIGISGTITTNGRNERQWYISKEYGSWYEKNKVYYRTPNHISPVKRDIAIEVGFPEISNGEDYAYSMGILPLLKTESKIKGNIYFYLFNSKK